MICTWVKCVANRLALHYLLPGLTYMLPDTLNILSTFVYLLSNIPDARDPLSLLILH